MNNKGFTMVELLATIALIAVIMLIFMPTIGNLISDFQENDKVDMLQKSAIMAAKEYVTDGKVDTSSINCSATPPKTDFMITIQDENPSTNDLVSQKYLDADDYYNNKKVKITYDCNNKKFIEYTFDE